jgi:hypothetical protein
VTEYDKADYDDAEATEAADESRALYPDFETWMIEWLVPTIHRPLRNGVLWCPKWWAHTEAVTRFDSLWRAWESARLEGGAAMSFWWVMHFDPHWSVMTSDRGPFAACKDRTHEEGAKRLDTLPCDSPPEDWTWPHDDPESQP